MHIEEHIEDEYIKELVDKYNSDNYLNTSTARFLALNSVTLKHVFSDTK